MASELPADDHLPSVPWPLRGVTQAGMRRALPVVRDGSRASLHALALPRDRFFHEAAHYAHQHRGELPQRDATEQAYAAMTQLWKPREQLIASLLLLGWWAEGCRPAWTQAMLRAQAKRALSRQQRTQLFEQIRDAQSLEPTAREQRIESLLRAEANCAARRIRNWLGWCRALLDDDTATSPGAGGAPPVPPVPSVLGIAIEIEAAGVPVGCGTAPAAGPGAARLIVDCEVARLSFSPLADGHTRPTLTTDEAELFVAQEIQIVIDGVAYALPPMPVKRRVLRGPAGRRRIVGPPLAWPLYTP